GNSQNRVPRSSPCRRQSRLDILELSQIQRAVLRCKCSAASKPRDYQQATIATPLARVCARNFRGNAVAQPFLSHSAANCADDGCDDRWAEISSRQCTFLLAFQTNASPE